MTAEIVGVIIGVIGCILALLTALGKIIYDYATLNAKITTNTGLLVKIDKAIGEQGRQVQRNKENILIIGTHLDIKLKED